MDEVKASVRGEGEVVEARGVGEVGELAVGTVGLVAVGFLGSAVLNFPKCF